MPRLELEIEKYRHEPPKIQIPPPPLVRFILSLLLGRIIEDPEED